MFGYDKAEEFTAVFNGGKAMTYPDDVLKAARKAAAEVADRLGKHGYRARYERGQFDNSIEVRAACIAIMAERERCASLCIDLRHPNYSSETEDWIAGTEACAVAILGQREKSYG